MCSACMTIWASASNSAHDASRRSLMLAEWAALTSTAPISSQAARSAPETTRSVIGSTLTSPSPARIVPDSSTSPDQPGGTASVASGSSTIAGPLDLRAGLGLAR